MRKPRSIILLALFLALSTSAAAVAAEKMISGAVCKKIGSIATVKIQVFVCTKEKGKLKWRQQVMKEVPAKAPDPSPAIAVLAIVPVVTLVKSDEAAVPIKATIYLESTSSLPASKYFLVVNAPRGLKPTCESGGQSTGMSSRYRTGSTTDRPKLEGATNMFPIPVFPITMECSLAEASEYKLFVVQAQNINGRDIAKSTITTIALPNYVAPTPRPSPSISTSSQLNISVGQVCTPEGLSAKASDGQTYLCKKSDMDSAFRWIKQG